MLAQTWRISFMDVNARCLGGTKFEMTARHQILSDQPFDNDGTDSAMTHSGAVS